MTAHATSKQKKSTLPQFGQKGVKIAHLNLDANIAKLKNLEGQNHLSWFLRF